MFEKKVKCSKKKSNVEEKSSVGRQSQMETETKMVRLSTQYGNHMINNKTNKLKLIIIRIIIIRLHGNMIIKTTIKMQ